MIYYYVYLAIGGIGRSLGDACQYIFTVAVSYGVCFYYEWRLALVLLLTFPLVLFGGLMTVTAGTYAAVSIYPSIYPSTYPSIGVIFDFYIYHQQIDNVMLI